MQNAFSTCKLHNWRILPSPIETPASLAADSRGTGEVVPSGFASLDAQRPDTLSKLRSLARNLHLRSQLEGFCIDASECTPFAAVRELARIAVDLNGEIALAEPPPRK